MLCSFPRISSIIRSKRACAGVQHSSDLSYLFLCSVTPPSSVSPPATVLRLSRFLRRFLLWVTEGSRDLNTKTLRSGLNWVLNIRLLERDGIIDELVSMNWNAVYNVPHSHCAQDLCLVKLLQSEIEILSRHKTNCTLATLINPKPIRGAVLEEGRRSENNWNH